MPGRLAASAGDRQPTAELLGHDPRPNSSKLLTESQKARLGQVVQRYMQLTGSTAASLAVTDRRRIVFEAGFGWQDLVVRRRVTSQSVFRLASLSKSLTATLIEMAIDEKLLEPQTPVLDILETRYPYTNPVDPRWRLITIEHLLQHRGGWDASKSFDPLGSAEMNSGGEQTELSAKKELLIRHMLKQPLQFEPGDATVYSNFGYFLLGEVVEIVFQQNYVECVNERIAHPLSVKSFRISKSSNQTALSDAVSYPHSIATERFELFGGAGCLSGSAPGLASYLLDYDLSGAKRSLDSRQSSYRFGSLPATTALAIQNLAGYDVVFFSNNRREFTYREDLGSLVSEFRTALSEQP